LIATESAKKNMLITVADLRRVSLLQVDAVDKYGGANLGDKTGQGRGVVFLAWGAWAAKRVAGLDKVRQEPVHRPPPLDFSL
jgi:hypothetical protein